MSHSGPEFEKTFPPYSYVPGLFPHPHSDALGHRFGAHLQAPAMFSAAQWPGCACYRLGVELFNAGYYWEAHEAWEKLWHAAGRRGLAATFLKGLIQLAVAGVKVRQGMPDSVRAHAARAAQLLREVAAVAGGTFMGLDPTALATGADAVAAQPPAGRAGAAVERVLPFSLDLGLPSAPDP